MAKVELKWFIDLPDYSEAVAYNLRTLLAVDIRKTARETVRVDTSNLRNSIRIDDVSEDTTEISANAAYALAQEYGRPDLATYGFTPYMRPALQKAKGNFDKLLKQAEDEAYRGSKR